MSCHNCGGNGHFASSCPKPKQCSNCGRRGHKKACVPPFGARTRARARKRTYTHTYTRTAPRAGSARRHLQMVGRRTSATTAAALVILLATARARNSRCAMPVESGAI